MLRGDRSSVLFRSRSPSGLGLIFGSPEEGTSSHCWKHCSLQGHSEACLPLQFCITFRLAYMLCILIRLSIRDIFFAVLGILDHHPWEKNRTGIAPEKQTTTGFAWVGCWMSDCWTHIHRRLEPHGPWPTAHGPCPLAASA